MLMNNGPKILDLSNKRKTTVKTFSLMCDMGMLEHIMDKTGESIYKPVNMNENGRTDGWIGCIGYLWMG